MFLFLWLFRNICCLINISLAIFFRNEKERNEIFEYFLLINLMSESTYNTSCVEARTTRRIVKKIFREKITMRPCSGLWLFGWCCYCFTRLHFDFLKYNFKSESVFTILVNRASIEERKYYIWKLYASAMMTKITSKTTRESEFF